jgi:hypothetical protein
MTELATIFKISVITLVPVIQITPDTTARLSFHVLHLRVSTMELVQTVMIIQLTIVLVQKLTQETIVNTMFCASNLNLALTTESVLIFTIFQTPTISKVIHVFVKVITQAQTANILFLVQQIPAKITEHVQMLKIILITPVIVNLNTLETIAK